MRVVDAFAVAQNKARHGRFEWAAVTRLPAVLVAGGALIGCPAPEEGEPGGLSDRALECGEAIRDLFETELTAKVRDPEQYPEIHEADLVEVAIHLLRQGVDERIREVQREVTATGDWGPCAAALAELREERVDVGVGINPE